MKIKIISIITIIFAVMSFDCINIVYADSLSDAINEQLNNIDLSKLEEYFNSIEYLPSDVDFFTNINQMLKGEYNLNFESIFEYIFNVFFHNIKEF